MSDVNWFATILIAVSLAVGIVIGVMLGPWSMLVAVAAAVIGTVAVHKFCEVKGTTHEQD